MIVIYTPKVTNRIKYTLDFVFSQYFGIEYELSENPVNIKVADNLYINYSKEKLSSYYNVFQDDLLLENDIHEQKIFVSREAEMPVFFQTTDHYELKFDIFSSIFYLISRYEEYLPHEKDIHGRYKFSNSILAKKEFNFSPIVETWLLFFKDELLKIKPTLSFKKYEFEYLPTFDIDNAFRYLGRNWQHKPPNIFQIDCLKTLIGIRKDAYDIFVDILRETKTNNLKPIFFFLLNDTDKNDSNVSPLSKKLHSVITNLKDVEIGIHPSYLAKENKSIEEEKMLLERILGDPITVSRQHFLKIDFPDYYRKLIKTGIKIDFSLSYPDIIGFRAGFSRSYYFFDLAKNESSTLKIQPSCWMDATFEYYQPLNNSEIQQNFLTLFNQLKKINGKLVTIFHNDLLAVEKYWGFFKFINQHINYGDEK